MKFKVVQNRKNASVNFTRSWTEYKAGFGEVTGNYWIGKLPNKSLTHLSFDIKSIFSKAVQNSTK